MTEYWIRCTLAGILVFMSDVTQILSSIEQGDPSAAEQLLPLVYEELRKLAAQKMAQERPGETLQATALVHEAYIRLVDVDNRSNLTRGDDSWYYQKKERTTIGVQSPKTIAVPNGLSPTSENKPWLKAFFLKNPSADTNGDGVLTKDVWKQFKSRK